MEMTDHSVFVLENPRQRHDGLQLLELKKSDELIIVIHTSRDEGIKRQITSFCLRKIS